MSPLERRDRRRAHAVVMKMWTELGAAFPTVSKTSMVSLIAAALRKEREETSRAAVMWFLFAGKNERARVKRACAKPASRPAFVFGGKK